MLRSTSLVLVALFPAVAMGCGSSSDGTCGDLLTCGDDTSDASPDASSGDDASHADGSAGSDVDAGHVDGSGQEASSGDDGGVGDDGGADGSCGDIDSSVTSCGSCGHTCPAPSAHGGATCVAGQCGVSCDAGYVACNGDCASESDGPSDACVVRDDLAVFVSAGGNDATGDGSQAKPVKTIGKGVALAASGAKGRVYVCGGTYANGVSLAAGAAAVTIFGGFDCSAAQWVYAPGQQHVVVAPATGYGLSVNGVNAAIEVDDVEFDSANATSAGGSSIAAFVASSANVALRRVTLKAGDAMAGAPGKSGTNWTSVDPSDPSIAGHDANGQTGGTQQDCSKLCANGAHSTGGEGGSGNVAAPSGGSTGGPNVGGTSPSDGAGGAAAAGAVACSNGHTGGSAGPSSGGAGAQTNGTLGASGWTVATSADGVTAGVGQGGGGGGGGISASKGGGGGGGCGGCGGGGGTAGKAGGSSFALLSYQSGVTLDACVLGAGKAGDGGKGGDGQAGQAGGFSGAPSIPGCEGGTGGAGGAGGGGGGGAAGLSIAIGYIGTQPQVVNGTTTTFASTLASGGGAGSGGSPGASKGAGGVAMGVKSL